MRTKTSYTDWQKRLKIMFEQVPRGGGGIVTHFTIVYNAPFVVWKKKIGANKRTYGWTERRMDGRTQLPVEHRRPKKTWIKKIKTMRWIMVGFVNKHVTASFLDASSHLYKRVCPSVCPSVRMSVRPYVRPSITIKEKTPKSVKIIRKWIIFWWFWAIWAIFNEFDWIGNRQTNIRTDIWTDIWTDGQTLL